MIFTFPKITPSPMLYCHPGNGNGFNEPNYKESRNYKSLKFIFNRESYKKL